MRPWPLLLLPLSTDCLNLVLIDFSFVDNILLVVSSALCGKSFPDARDSELSSVDGICCFNRSSMSAYLLWTDSQSTLSYVFDTLYSFVTVKRSSTSSSVQMKAFWADVFLAFCRIFFDVAILKRTMCWGVLFTLNFAPVGNSTVFVFSTVHTDTLENAMKTLVWTQINRCVFTPIENAFKQKRISVDMALVLPNLSIST